MITDDEESKASIYSKELSVENDVHENDTIINRCGYIANRTPIHEVILEQEVSSLCHHHHHTSSQRRQRKISTIQMRLNQLRIPTDPQNHTIKNNAGDNNNNKYELEEHVCTENTKALFRKILTISKCNVYRMVTAIATITLNFIVYHLRRKGLGHVGRSPFSF